MVVAMTEMSMNRAIHGAIRRDLDRFVAALDAFPPGDRNRAQQLNTAWANFDAQLTTHHEGEHTIAWPALRSVGVSEQTLAQLDAEHDAMAAALGEARTAMVAFTRTAGGEEAAAALAAVRRLREVTAEHLTHEEAEIEPVYQDKRDTPELKAMGKAFGRVSPAQGGRFFAWVLDGASPEEEAAVRSSVPGPVLTVIGGLFGRSYRRDVATAWRG
jgi:hemerythrin-like domain-containing protein